MLVLILGAGLLTAVAVAAGGGGDDDGRTSGAGAGVVTSAVDVVVVTVVLAELMIKFVAGAFTDVFALATVDGELELGASVVLFADDGVVVVDILVDDDADSTGMVGGGGDCTMTGFSMFALCFNVDSDTIFTAGNSVTIFGFGMVFCAAFFVGVVGTTITGFGMGIAFFDDNECETDLNNPSVLIRIFGCVDRAAFADDEPAVEVFFDADLLVRASLFFRSFFGFTTLVTSTSIPLFDSSSSYGKKSSGSTPTSISVTSETF